MPQLNPAPWFTTMLITWCFLLITLAKITTYSPTLSPTQDFKTSENQTWTWPWH